ncbi:MAG: hypothetical protein KAI64_06875, partial [Thermoplasmata archaeon]|nr:hypothetical protein [Thermoplasmata archaeon]
GGISSKNDRKELMFRQKFSLLLPRGLKRKSHRLFSSVRPNSWYEENDLSLEDMRRITGRESDDEPIRASSKRKHATKSKRKVRNARKVRAKVEDEDEDEDLVDEEENEDNMRYSKKMLNERLVARAMSHYER